MKKTKETTAAQKLRGGYYTPKAIADFLCNWSIQEGTNNILEPSCGDGNFIESAIFRLQALGMDNDEISGRLKGIELQEEEALKAKMRADSLGIDSGTIVNNDFFNYISNNSTDKYDVILGNPPFIRYQNFPEEHRSVAIEMMQKLALHPNKLTNIWVPFLVISASLLSDTGKMAMVIPAELFQVKYAAETRVFLSNIFQRLTIITFKKLVFDNIQQEVVLLLCEKQAPTGQGIRVIECENMADLESINFTAINGLAVKPIDHSTEKWTKYFLEENEINLLKRLKNDPRVTSCGNLMSVDVGIVTGRNDFFMLKEDQVREWDLLPYTIPVTSKSLQLKGITFSDTDFSANSSAQNAVHLFMPPNEDFDKLPIACQKYIKHGEKEGFNTGYKTSIRKRWYITPSLWVPDAFALRQVGDYPKLILNTTGASSTDTIHRVRFQEGVNRQRATIAFINSLSFAFSEITGRSYGGGVMTFEPTEIEEIKIPILGEMTDLNFEILDALIRKRKIEEALDMVDEILLIRQHQFTRDEVITLRGIWRKLSNRRQHRK